MGQVIDADGRDRAAGDVEPQHAVAQLHLKIAVEPLVHERHQDLILDLLAVDDLALAIDDDAVLKADGPPGNPVSAGDVE